jgi:hypothetical protein
MIRRLSCPGCNRVLRLDDSRNLAAGKCPACGQKFLIPGAAEQPEPRPPAVSAPRAPRPAAPPTVPRAAPPRQEPSLPPARSSPNRADPFADADGDPSAYQIHLEDAPRPVEDHRPEAEGIDDGADYEEIEPRKRRKKKKKKRSSPGMSLEMSNFLITMGVLGVLWLGLTALVFFAPDTTLLVLLVGCAVCSIGQSWFMRIVWEDGVGQALMCLFVPFYSFLYLIGNFERAGKPFAVRLFGGLIIVSALIAMIARGMLFDRHHHEDDFGREWPAPGMQQGGFGPDDD